MQLFVDYLPILFFFVAYIATNDIFVAVMSIMIVAPIVLAGQWLMTRKINKMTAASTGLIVVLGGITLVLKNPVFFYWKPTVLYWAFGLACLVSQFIGEKPIVQRMLEAATKDSDTSFDLAPAAWRKLNFMWIGYFIVSGALNIYVAYSFSEPTWVKFKLFGLLGLTIVFIIIQSMWIATVSGEDSHQSGNGE